MSLALKHAPCPYLPDHEVVGRLTTGGAEVGHARQIDRVLRRAEQEPVIAERVTSSDLMMALVSAGFALGLTGAAQIASSREAGVVARPLAGRSPILTTYLLRREGEISEVLARFIERVQAIESPEGLRHAPSSQSYNPQDIKQ